MIYYLLASLPLVYFILVFVIKRIKYDLHKIPIRKGPSGDLEGNRRASESQSKPICRVTVIPGLKYNLEVNDPDLARELLVKQQGYGRATSTVRRANFMPFAYGATFGDMVGGLQGHEWKWRRDMLVPHFQSRKMLPPLLPYVIERSVQMVDQLKSASTTGEPVELDLMMTEATIDIIFKYVLGETRDSINKQIEFKDTTSLSTVYRNIWHGAYCLIIPSILLGINSTWFLPKGWHETNDECLDYMTKVLDCVLPKYKGKDDKDVPLAVLLSRDQRYSWDTVQGRKNLIAEINVLMFAGHDTTGHSLSILMYRLAQNKSHSRRRSKMLGNFSAQTTITADFLAINYPLWVI